MQPMYQFQTADHIFAGAGSIKSLGENLRLVGKEVKRALVITQASLKEFGLLDDVYSQLEKHDVTVETVTNVLPEPTLENIEEIFNEIKSNNYDVLIGVGGGSVLDATKILSVLKTNEQPLQEMLGTDLVKNPGVPTILIPTTAGTGSEVTPNAIVTIPAEELKIGVVSRFLLPTIVFIDPLITLGLPKPFTAATGMDAFTHSLESFISNKANPISNTFALDSIRLISESILESYNNGSSVEAREKMLIGSMYGGMALTSAGTAAVHALAYPLGGKFHIPHGVANSMLLPHVMEFNKDVIIDELAQVAKAMGIYKMEDSQEEAAEKVINQITEWTKALNIPQNLAEFGVSEGDIQQLAESAAKVTRLLDNNPKAITIEEMKQIYRKLLPN